MGKKTLNIAFICPFLFRFQRGIERACANLANALANLGHSVTILAWAHPNGKAATPLHRDIQVITVPYVRYYQAKWAIPFYAWALLKNTYDVVNIFFADNGEAEALWVAHRFQKLQINFIVGYPIEQATHRFRQFQRLGLGLSLSHVIVKSPFMKAGVAQFFGREVTCIPNGIDIELFQPADAGTKEAARHQLGLKSDDCVLLTVAALEERKGIQFVIRLLPQLLVEGAPVHYVIVGNGPYRLALETLAAKLGVAKQVHMIGTVTNVLPFYAAADLFLLLSHGEGFPNVLLEAWSMALPVIVSHHPPYPDIVPNHIGMMLDENDQEILQQRVKHLLSDAQIRAKMGLQARQHVKALYTWRRVAAQYIDLFLG